MAVNEIQEIHLDIEVKVPVELLVEAAMSSENVREIVKAHVEKLTLWQLRGYAHSVVNIKGIPIRFGKIHET